MVQGSPFKCKGPAGTCLVFFSYGVPGGLRGPGLSAKHPGVWKTGIPFQFEPGCRGPRGVGEKPGGVGVLGRCGSRWPGMSPRPLGMPPARGVCTHGVQKTQRPCSCHCYISVWTKIYKPKKKKKCFS